EEWARRGREYGVAFETALAYSLDGRSRPFARLGFGSLAEKELREAVVRIARARPVERMDRPGPGARRCGGRGSATGARRRAALVDRYARGPSLLRSAFAAVPEAARSFRSAPGRWSPHQVVCHCADAEMIAAVRIRFVLAEDHPVLVGYDQDRWAERLPYEEQPPEVALAVVDAVFAHTATLPRPLPGGAGQKEAALNETGRTQAQEWGPV